jgi:hypothetical protein
MRSRGGASCGKDAAGSLTELGRHTSMMVFTELPLTSSGWLTNDVLSLAKLRGIKSRVELDAEKIGI